MLYSRRPRRRALGSCLVQLLILTAFSLAAKDLSPKGHFKHAETLLRQGQIFTAFDHFKRAAELAPRNKKYQRKLTEVRGKASQAKYQEAAAEESSNLENAESSLLAALEYDPDNQQAADLLAQVRAEINTVDLALRQSLEILDLLGDHDAADSLVSSVESKLRRVPKLFTLSDQVAGEIDFARSVYQARQSWDHGRKDVVTALEELAVLSKRAIQSTFVRSSLETLRGEVTEALVARVTPKVADPVPADLLTSLNQLELAADAPGATERIRPARQALVDCRRDSFTMADAV